MRIYSKTVFPTGGKFVCKRDEKRDTFLVTWFGLHDWWSTKWCFHMLSLTTNIALPFHQRKYLNIYAQLRFWVIIDGYLPILPPSLFFLVVRGKSERQPASPISQPWALFDKKRTIRFAKLWFSTICPTNYPNLLNSPLCSETPWAEQGRRKTTEVWTCPRQSYYLIILIR